MQEDEHFPQQGQAPLRFIERRQADAAQLQAKLDAEKTGLEKLRRQIVTAWQLGVVGENERARCVAFETSLMNVIVADRFTVPELLLRGTRKLGREAGLRG